MDDHIWPWACEMNKKTKYQVFLISLQDTV